MIFFGANDGMIHAVDARTGYEVWAFIPYNLLPKLRRCIDGQPVEQFDYFVDSSPKIAEVKLSGTWRTLLLIGQGPAARSIRPSTSPKPAWASTRPTDGSPRCHAHAGPVRHAGRVDQVQVGVPELLELRSDLYGDVHCHRRHAGRQGRSSTAISRRRPTTRRRPSASRGRIRRSVRSTRPIDQRRHRRLRLLPGRSRR